MVLWIVLGVVAVAALLLWKGMRTMWAESTARVRALPSVDDRRTWPVPTDVGDRVMWCPILAKKVVLADTRVDEGEIGSVMGFTDKRWPIISFDERGDQPDVTDKWGAARRLPDALARPRKSAPPSARSQAGKKRKNRKR